MTSTTELLTRVLEIMERVMEELFRGYHLMIFGSIVFTLTFSLFLVRKNKKRSYTGRLECTMIYHWILIAALPAISGYLVWKFWLYSAGYVAAAILAALFALFASWLLIRMKWTGVVCADLSLILDLCIYHVWVVRMVRRSFAEMGRYNPAGMYALTGVSYRWIVVAITTLLAVAALVIVNAVYYSRRYYLFFPGEIRIEAVCPVCGSAVFEGEKYCAMCGGALPEGIAAKPNQLLRGTEKYCTGCGHILRNGRCLQCRHSGFVAEDFRENLLSDLLEKGKGYVWVLLFVVLGLVPILLNPSMDLAKDSAAIHNAYVEKLRDYEANHEIAKNEEWLADYRGKYEALAIKDSQWITVDHRLLTSSTIPFFTAYSDAAYDQVEVIEEIDAEILMSAAGEEIREDAFRSKLDRFDQSVEDMGDAGFYSISMKADWGILRKLGNYLIDGLQFWSRYISFTILGVLLIAAGIVFHFLLLRDLYEKKSFAAMLDPIKGVRAVIAWLGGLMSGKTTGAAVDVKYRKTRIVEKCAVAGLCVLFIAAGFTIGRHFKTDDEIEALYMNDCAAILLQSMQEQQLCVNQLLKRQITEEDLQLIIETFQQEIERDRAYLARTDIPEGYEEFDARMDELCREDMEMLTGILDDLNNGVRPAREVLSRLSGLRLREYRDLTYGYADYMVSQAADALSG